MESTTWNVVLNCISCRLLTLSSTSTVTTVSSVFGGKRGPNNHAGLCKEWKKALCNEKKNNLVEALLYGSAQYAGLSKE